MSLPATRSGGVIKTTRRLALATAVSVFSALAGGALAQQSASPVPAAAKPADKAPATKAKPPSAKVTAEEKAEADRMDPLAQAAFWDKVVQADPRDVGAQIKLAKALRALSRFDEAEAASREALIIEPNNVEALLESARDFVASGQGFFAIEPAERAASLAPRDWRCASLLAIGLEQDQRDDEALAAHRRALALAPDNPAALTNLGMFEAAHGQAADAEALLRRAAAAPGATTQERENLALVLGLEGHFDEAERLERRDLPPEMVDNNLNYLHAVGAPKAQRTWASVEKAQ